MTPGFREIVSSNFDLKLCLYRDLDLVYCVIDIFDHDHDHDHEKNIVLNHDHEFFSNDNHDHDHDHEVLCSYNHDHDHDHDFFTIFSRLYHECYIVFRDTRKIFNSHICGAK
jgi:hypothetical protein